MKLLAAAVALLTITASNSDIVPGNWETTVTLNDITLSPGAPPGMAEGMRAAMGGDGITSQSCVTQEDIDEGPENFLNGSGDNCEYSDMQMTNGIIRGSAICESNMNIVLEGTYTDTTYSMNVTANGDMGEEMGPMTLSMAIEGRRLGDCSG